MRLSLFWRTFAAFMALTLFTVGLCTGVLAAYMQAERQSTYEGEVRQQACEVAEYMAHLNALHFVRDNTTMQFVIRSANRDRKRILAVAEKETVNQQSYTKRQTFFKGIVAKCICYNPFLCLPIKLISIQLQLFRKHQFYQARSLPYYRQSSLF